MKLRSLALAVALTFVMCTTSLAANKIRAYTALTGGGAGAMDSTSCSNLTTNDLALVMAVGASTMYWYRFLMTQAQADDESPFFIVPDDQDTNCDVANQGAWILLSGFALGRSAKPQTIYRDSGATDFDDNVYWVMDCPDDFGSGTEDCDISLWVQIAGTATQVFTVDADGDIYVGSKTTNIPKQRIDIAVQVFAPTTDTATGDGKSYFTITPEQDGKDLVYAHAQVVSAGTTGTMQIQIARCAAVTTGNACSGTVADMLSGLLEVETGEDSSDTDTGGYTINGANDTVATNQVIRIDIDAVQSGTAAKGLVVTLGFAEAQPGTPAQ